ARQRQYGQGAAAQGQGSARQWRSLCQPQDRAAGQGRPRSRKPDALLARPEAVQGAGLTLSRILPCGELRGRCRDAAEGAAAFATSSVPRSWSGARSSVPRGGGAFQPIVDGFAQPVMRNRRDRDALSLGIELVQHRKQVAGGFVQIARGGEIERPLPRTERQVRLAGLG